MKRFILLTLTLIGIITTPVYANSLTTDVITAEDYNTLAHLLNGEAGATYCSDELIYYVGSVVLNRVEDEDFPNTIKEVVFQKGQYQCTWNGLYDLEPSERCWRIAFDLLENGSVLPDYVIWQAEFPQGAGYYCKEQNMYFSTKRGTR